MQNAPSGTQEVSQFRSAEMIAENWKCSREDMEVFSLESHTRAFKLGGDSPCLTLSNQAG